MKKEKTISSVEQFHEIIKEHWNSHYLFRGEDSVNYKLRSHFGRDMIQSSENTSIIEKSYFQEFKRTALPFLEYRLENDWDWIAIAQHHGLHTRLLDWSENPLVAAYFAVRENRESDSIFYIFDRNELNFVDIAKDPFSITSNLIFKPNHLSRRISAQSCLFTIHHKPEEIFDVPSLERIVLKSECLTDLWITLGLYNINEFTMFPSLNGLAYDLTINYIRTI